MISDNIEFNDYGNSEFKYSLRSFDLIRLSYVEELNELRNKYKDLFASELDKFNSCILDNK